MKDFFNVEAARLMQRGTRASRGSRKFKMADNVCGERLVLPAAGSLGETETAFTDDRVESIIPRRLVLRKSSATRRMLWNARDGEEKQDAGGLLVKDWQAVVQPRTFKHAPR